MHYHQQVMKRFLFLTAATLLAAGAAFGQGPSGKAAGSPGAPITIEVFSDFQCPSCKVFHEQVVTPLRRDYVIPGKVYLINRDFPLPMHAYSRLAALYANAAARIGKYEQVADVLFRNQAVWAERGTVDETVCRILSPAEAAKVRKLVKDPAVAADIKSDEDLGTKIGLRQTPTTIIRQGSAQYPIAGSVSYDLFRQFLDDRLKK